jgi:hypothetical protein
MIDYAVNAAIGFLAGVALALLIDVYRRVREIHGKVVVLPDTTIYR